MRLKVRNSSRSATTSKDYAGSTPPCRRLRNRPRVRANGYHSAIASDPNALKWVQVDLGRTVPLDEIHLVPARPTDFADTPGSVSPSGSGLNWLMSRTFTTRW